MTPEQRKVGRSEQLRLLEGVCDEFEAKWSRGERPSIAALLEKLPDELRGETFRELLAIEIGYRRRQGEQPSATEYQPQFATYADAISQEFRGCPQTPHADCETKDDKPKVHPVSPILSASPMDRWNERGGAEPPSPPLIPPARTRPDRLKDYTLVEEIGHSGVGTLFMAKHGDDERVVALKLLPRDALPDAAGMTLFLREMEAVEAIDHPNIARTFETDAAEGQYYVVTEFLVGTDLSEIVEKVGPLEIADACETIRQAAIGLQHVHEHGMVHRNLRPSNLMVCTTQEKSDGDSLPDGGTTIKILGLGLAQLDTQPAARRGVWATTEQLMATVDYMAPEQLLDTHSADIRTDIYSLGGICFTLLTGEPPLSGEQFNSLAKKLAAVATSSLPSVSIKRPELPRELVAIVDRMLARDPHKRFASPLEAAKALAPFTHGHRLHALLAAARLRPQGSGLLRMRSEIGRTPLGRSPNPFSGQNPAAPTSDSVDAPVEQRAFLRTPNGWVLRIAAGWPVVLMLYLLAPPRLSPAGKFFLNVVTTAISIAAGCALVWFPRGWWKVAGILLLFSLLYLQLAIWAHYFE